MTDPQAPGGPDGGGPHALVVADGGVPPSHAVPDGAVPGGAAAATAAATPAVAAALARLETLDGTAVGDQVEVFDEVHRLLQDALATLDEA